MLGSVKKTRPPSEDLNNVEEALAKTLKRTNDVDLSLKVRLSQGITEAKGIRDCCSPS
jgi:hypothetical protein